MFNSKLLVYQKVNIIFISQIRKHRIWNQPQGIHPLVGLSEESAWHLQAILGEFITDVLRNEGWINGDILHQRCDMVYGT